MKASKLFSPLLVGLLMGWFLCQPAPVFAVVATGTGGGTTLTDSASLRSALSDETGTGVAVFGTSPTITDSLTITSGTANTAVLTSSGYSLTGSNATALVSLAGTWNTSGTPNAIDLDITNTASNAASNLINLKVGGSSRLRVTPTTGAYVTSSAASGIVLTLTSAYGTCVAGVGGDASVTFDKGLHARYLHCSNDGDNIRFGTSSDLVIERDAANSLGLRNGTNPQTLGIYNTYTSSTNQEKYQTVWSSNVCYTGTKAGSTSGSNRLEVHHGGAEKTLTESSATAFAQVAVASGASVAGRVDYQIYADDSTDFQTRSGSVHFSGVNKAGTETATLGTVLNESVAASTGTLTVTFDTDTSPTNAFTIRANAVSSLTQTTLKIIYRVELFGPQVTVTPQ